MKIDGKTVIWPAYIDSRKTRRKGRRIPRKITIDSPKIKEALNAATKLGLNPEQIDDAALPNTWWEKTGYIIVEKKGKTKIEILKELAVQIAKERKESNTDR